MNSRRRVNSTVMSLPFEQLCGSRFDYKVVHAAVRIVCLISALMLAVLFYSTKFFQLTRNTPLDDISLYWFFSSPVIILAIAVTDSIWFRRTQPETQALAIDWLFALAYLAFWCYQMVKILLSFPVML